MGCAEAREGPASDGGRVGALPPQTRLGRLGGFASLSTDLPTDLPHLAGQVPLDVVAPDHTAGAILIRAVLEAGQLLPPRPHQCIEHYQLGFEFRCVSRFAILHHEPEAL